MTQSGKSKYKSTIIRYMQFELDTTKSGTSDRVKTSGS